MTTLTPTAHLARQLDPESDDALVARFRAGTARSQEAFEEIVHRYRARVRRRATAILGNAADAEDVAQDVFMRVYRALPDYDAQGRFDHWLERIVTNSCRMHIRSRVRYERRLRTVEVESKGRVTRATAEGRTDAIRTLAKIVDHTDGALWMRATEGLPYSQIATRLGISESAAKMRVKRCRDGLHQRLETSAAASAPL